LLTPEREPVFGWEGAHRSDRLRVFRKATQLAVDLLLFCVSAVVAVAIYWTLGAPDIVLLGVSCLEVIVVATLAVHIWRYAEIRP
jgi:hypothetical protein